MDTKFDHDFDHEVTHVDQIVYVRPVEVSDLPDDVRAHIPGRSRIYAVHNSDGQRLALVKDRELAFILARQHDMTPVTVH